MATRTTSRDDRCRATSTELVREGTPFHVFYFKRTARSVLKSQPRSSAGRVAQETRQ